MLGYLGYRAVRGQYRLYKKSRAEKGGPWTLTAVTFCVLPFTALWMLAAPFQRHYALAGALLGVNALLALLALAPALARRALGRRVMAAYRPPQELASPENMRKRAEMLELLEPLMFPEALDGEPPVPAPGPGDDGERERRVASLLSAECTACGAPPGTACVIDPPPTVILRASPLAFCHFPRIALAVGSGAASREEVLAQFGGKLPEGLEL